MQVFFENNLKNFSFYLELRRIPFFFIPWAGYGSKVQTPARPELIPGTGV